MNYRALNPRQIRFFGALCWLVYFTSYLTRINYGAVIAEIVSSTGILKSQAGIVTTFSFISYGAGQLVSGFLGDRLDPKKLIFGGLLATALCNILMPFCGGVRSMALVWCVNGFAQSMMWPPLVKTMTLYLDDEQYKKACVSVTMSSAVSTIVIYLASPACIVYWGWKPVFFISAAAAVAVALVWSFGLAFLDRKAETKKKRVFAAAEPAGTEENSLSARAFFGSGILLIGAGIILQGLLRDGITTWMPSYLSETFHLGNAAAILTTVVIPLFGMFSIKLTEWIHQKFLRDEVVCAAAIFGTGFACCLLMRLFSSYSMVLSVVAAAAITGCMHGINLMLICMVPQKFNRYGVVSTVSGLLNSLTYVGSALSSYGFAKLSEGFGWSFTLTTWCAISFFGLLTCLGCIRHWKRFKQLS